MLVISNRISPRHTPQVFTAAKEENLVPRRGRHSPPLIVEEARLLGLNDDHVKQVPPVLPNDIAHPFVPRQHAGWVSLARKGLTVFATFSCKFPL